MSRHLRFALILAAALPCAAGVAWAAAIQVDQVGARFNRASADLHVGDHITFLNTDDVQHNISVTDESGGIDSKGLQNPGQTIDVAFTKTGQYLIRCQIHPKMKMKVNVQ